MFLGVSKVGKHCPTKNNLLLFSDKREYTRTSNWTQRDFSQQPYSSSLENLDPSAKEFMVDAGVVLDKSSIINTVSSSMPNLSKINGYIAGNSDPGRSGESEGSEQLGPDGKKGNLEGEFSKYLISNEEMEQYEAEYQRCANALASGNSDPASLIPASMMSRVKPVEVQVSPTRGRDSASSGMFSTSEKLMSISSMAQVTFFNCHFFLSPIL